MLGLAPEPFPIRCLSGVWVSASANKTAVAALELNQSPRRIDITEMCCVRSRTGDTTTSLHPLEIGINAFDGHYISSCIGYTVIEVGSTFVVTVAKYGLEHILTSPLAFQGFIPARVDHCLLRGWRLTRDVLLFSGSTARGRA